MTGSRVLKIATAALLLGALPLVIAHGGHGEQGDQADQHGEGSMAMEPSEVPQSYWRLSEHAALMYWHIGFEVLAWFVVLPVAVMLSIAQSRLVLPIQFLFLILNASALLLGVVYNHKTTDLYENNAHGKIGWIITWIAVSWVCMGLFQTYIRRAKAHAREHLPSQRMTAANMAQYQRVEDAQLPNPSRWSNDSGQGTERNSASLCASRSPSVESGDHLFSGPTRRYTQDELDDVLLDGEAEKRSFLRNTALDGYLSRKLARFATDRSRKVLRFIYVVFERTLPVQGFVAFCSGTVVYGGIGHGGAVFNVLAHYIKGGIFIGYGLLTLGRWMGAFADLGWAWNQKPSAELVGRRRAALPSAEFTESFVIFLYGCINVFLEHLAAWGDAWAPQDLEHVSISVMFFGGGLLGMIIESSKVRALLNSEVISSQPPSQYSAGSWLEPRQYRFSMNPMPGLIILLLGKMMSAHHQDSMVSAMIHTQWGGMFMGFAAARAVTYITMYLSPPTSYLPSRPPSEVISAFCLLAGGVTFVVSNKDTVAALESYGLDAMFTFTVTMGLTSLVMAWATIVMAIKGWAVRRAHMTVFSKGNAGTPA